MALIARAIVSGDLMRLHGAVRMVEEAGAAVSETEDPSDVLGEMKVVAERKKA